MSHVRLFFFILFGLFGACFLTGCATEAGANDPNRVSSIPWNRPESWEGGGPLGGMMNTQ